MDLISEALAYWRGAQERRVSTIHRYTSSLRRLAKLGLPSTESVTRERVLLLQRTLMAQGWKASSVRTEFAALRSVLDQLVLDGLFPKAVLLDLREIVVPLPKRERKMRVRFLTRIEFERLVEAARRVEPRMEWPLRVAVWSGARIGELARMTREEVREGYFWVQNIPEYGEAGSCKTGERPVPICQELARALEGLPQHGWLFPSGTLGGRRPSTPFLSRWTLERGMSHVRAAAGFGRDVTFTTLRHTRASWWAQAGVPLVKIADWLGHDQKTCSDFYVSLTDGYDPDCERLPAA